MSAYSCCLPGHSLEDDFSISRFLLRKRKRRALNIKVKLLILLTINDDLLSRRHLHHINGNCFNVKMVIAPEETQRSGFKHIHFMWPVELNLKKEEEGNKKNLNLKFASVSIFVALAHLIHSFSHFIGIRNDNHVRLAMLEPLCAFRCQIHVP